MTPFAGLLHRGPAPADLAQANRDLIADARNTAS